MSTKILMPALSPTMTEGSLAKWLIKEGDQVKAGDVIAEIETDKATMEVEAVDEGVVTKLLFKEGSKGILVNSTIAVLNGTEEENKNNETSSTKKDIFDSDNKNIKKTETKLENNDTSLFSIKKYDNKKIFASPYVKKISREKNINLNTLKGSGPEGRIIKRDLDNSNPNDNVNIDHEVIVPSTIRKVIAEKTTNTKNTVPHFYLTIETNVDKMLKLKNLINQQNSDLKVSINDLLVKSIAIAQKMNPKTNVSWRNNQIIKYSSIDVSIAVALKDGLLTPIIKNADKKGIIEISNEIKTLVQKSKAGKLLPEEYEGGTVSISNLGMFGISEFKAIINSPQSCILAVGAIKKILTMENKIIKEIHVIKSTLSADHRVLDGAVAAKLLKDFNDIIENPFNLWLNSKDLEIL